METIDYGTLGNPHNDPTISDYVKLVKYCVLGFELRILDEDAIIRRVAAFCKENNLSDTLHTDIIRAIIEGVYGISKKPIGVLFNLLVECETSQWHEDVDFVVWSEINRRDRALGIKR